MESRQRLLCKSLGAWSCKTKDLIIFIFMWFPYSCSHLSIILLWFQYPVFYVLVLAPSLGIRDIWDFFSSNLNNEIDFFLLRVPWASMHTTTPPSPTSPQGYLPMRRGLLLQTSLLESSSWFSFSQNSRDLSEASQCEVTMQWTFCPFRLLQPSMLPPPLRKFCGGYQGGVRNSPVQSP